MLEQQLVTGGLVRGTGPGNSLWVPDLADVVGGGAEEHRRAVERELREPVRHRVGELRGHIVHGPQVRGEARRRVQDLQQGDDLVGQGP